MLLQNTSKLSTLDSWILRKKIPMYVMWHDAKCHDFSNMIEAGLGLRKLYKFEWAKCQFMTNVINYCLSSFRIKYLNNISLKFMSIFWFLFSKENGDTAWKKDEIQESWRISNIRIKFKWYFNPPEPEPGSFVLSMINYPAFFLHLQW